MIKGIILCAGKGTRLQPFTFSSPKTLLPVANRLLNLPVGKCAVVHIPEKLIDLFPALRDFEVTAGPHVGSLYYKDAKVVQNQRDLKNCVNLSKAAGMIAFDHWIQNWDRHWKEALNILVVREPQQSIALIDHANAFTGHWTIESLKENRTKVSVYWGGIYELFVPHIDGHSPFEKILGKINLLSRSELREAMEGLPPEWNVSHRELQKLAKYLDYRKPVTAEALSQLKNYFPRWNAR